MTKAKNKDSQNPTTKTTKKKSGKSQEIIISNEENVDSEKLRKPKKWSHNNDDGKMKQIDKYFNIVKSLPSIVTPKQKIMPPKNKQEAQSPQIETCSTPLSLTQLSFDFDNSTDDIHDLSDIINGIVSNSPTIKDIGGKKLHYECLAKHLDPIKVIATDAKDETADEFDIIVAGMKPIRTDTNTPTASRKKTKKRPFDKRLPAKSIDDRSPSTTPILIEKFFKRNRIDHKSSVMTSSTPTSSPKTLPQNVSFESIASPKENVANVSYFFGDITEENDAFEKLIDFRNMVDVVDANNEDDIACRGDELQDTNDTPPIELNGTFDLDNYVPVGANLRKLLAT